MKREDYNLISSLLFAAIKEGEAEPRIALRFAAVLAHHVGSTFSTQDFVDRCVPQKKRAKVGKISRGAVEPKAPRAKSREEEEPYPFLNPGAALFTAILAVEFPALLGRVSCTLSTRQESIFTIWRIGGKVWIRFGTQAISDPIAAVRAAAPDAEAMALRQTAASKIVSR